MYERLRRTLSEHYLVTVICNTDRKQDNPVCQCSRVHLGWYPSVGEAVDGWIDHVIEVLDGSA